MDSKKCPECGGSGVITHPDRWGYPMPEDHTCPACNGTGQAPESGEAIAAQSERIVCATSCRAGALSATGINDEAAEWLGKAAALIERDGEHIQQMQEDLDDYSRTERERESALRELVEAVATRSAASQTCTCNSVTRHDCPACLADFALDAVLAHCEALLPKEE